MKNKFQNEIITIVVAMASTLGMILAISAIIDGNYLDIPDWMDWVLLGLIGYATVKVVDLLRYATARTKKAEEERLKRERDYLVEVVDEAIRKRLG